jgi:hypothetical protein
MYMIMESVLICQYAHDMESVLICRMHVIVIGFEMSKLQAHFDSCIIHQERNEVSKPVHREEVQKQVTSRHSPYPRPPSITKAREQAKDHVLAIHSLSD